MAYSPARPAATGWQFILADLALILFLLALTGLPLEPEMAQGGDPGEKMLGRKPPRAVRAASPSDPRPSAAVAPAQALYRPITGGPRLADWLAGQPQDPRATLTIFARYPQGEERAAWRAAETLAREAAGSGLAIRTIIAAGDEHDLYASLAYDSPTQAAPP